MRILNVILLICFFCVGVQAERLNFLFIYLDDTTFDSGDYREHLSCIKSLEAQAIVFENFYTSLPSESTVEMLTGKYPASVKNVALNADLDAQEPSFMREFKELDYATAYIGKWRNSIKASAFANNFGFDLFYGILDSDSKWPYDWQRKGVDKGQVKPDGTGIKKPMLRMYQGSNIINIAADNKKLIGEFSNEALSFIDEAFQAEQPFFIYLNFASAYSQECAVGKFFKEEAGSAYAKHYGEVDEAIAKIVKDLKRKEIFDNTVLVFVSTNALKEPAPKVDYSKNLAPEKRHKLSAFVSAPSVFNEPKSLKGIISTMDMPSLLMDIAQQKSPDLIFAKYKNTSKPVLYYNLNKKLLGIRVGDYKFLINVDWNKVKAQLYDLNADPYEQNDLSESMPDKMAELKNLLWQLDSRVVKILSQEEIEKRKKEAEKAKRHAQEKAEKEAKNKAQREKERLKKEEKQKKKEKDLLEQKEKQKKKDSKLQEGKKDKGSKEGKIEKKDKGAKDKGAKEEKQKKKAMLEGSLEENSEGEDD